jgi:hypothetical protein
MKIVSILVSILVIGFFAHGEESESSVGVQQATLEQPGFGKTNSVWNVNLGMSQFDRGDIAGTNYRGNGITVEIQRRFADMFYVGASYTNYSTESTGYYNNYDPSAYYNTRNYLDIFSASLEAHPIRLPLLHNSELFATVNFGVMGVNAQDPSQEGGVSSSYYGAGIGFNYSNQVGIRMDVKSNRDFRAFNTISLVGYY